MSSSSISTKQRIENMVSEYITETNDIGTLAYTGVPDEEDQYRLTVDHRGDTSPEEIVRRIHRNGFRVVEKDTGTNSVQVVVEFSEAYNRQYN